VSIAQQQSDQDAETGPSIDLLPHQDRELAHLLDPDSNVTYPLTFICGGRGSGKSETDYLQFFLRSERCVDQPFALFANTDAQLQTFIAIITEKLDAIGMRHVYETKAPAAWRRRWRREGIRVPPRRLRNLKMWIWEDGTHIFCGTLLNNAYTRAKSLDIQAALIEEATEPGVTRNAITTILGAVRCGLGRVVNGESECKRRGHLHEVVVKFNVPLLDPSNYIYRYAEEMAAKEMQREAEHKPPFFRMIESGTRDNPHTGEDYDERLRAALDEDTYEEQTKGRLVRNVASLSYSKFSEQNILNTLAYDPKRPLHIWFDFNTTPAVAGWGHDLRTNEVPEIYLRDGHDYFGVVGELFSGAEPMVTDQVAHALLEDPTGDSRCSDCGCQLELHLETGSGFICKSCSWRSKGGEFCAGRPIEFDRTRKKFLHLRPDDKWRGLIKHRGLIYVYGDATGGATHSDAYDIGGNIKILRDVFGANLGQRVHFRFKQSNPAVRLRVLAMQRALRATNGVRGIFLGDWCTAHVDDFREVVPDPKTGMPKKVGFSQAALKAGGYCLRTHASDAFGYKVDYRWPAVGKGGGFLPMREDVGTSRSPLETNWREPERL
jgi:hypothetical protein